MKLPRHIKIGKTRYFVGWFDAMLEQMGFFRPALRAINVATRKKGKPRKPEAIAETFWHEVTHAILHDMDHPLWKDEKFVTAFSKRLSKAIDSARFE